LFGTTGHANEGYREFTDKKQVGGKGHHHLKDDTIPLPAQTSLPEISICFFNLKEHLSGQKFHEGKELKNKVTTWLCVQAAEFYDIGIQILIPRLNKCLDKCSDYVKK
jgi:hypothetical protein